MAKHRDECVNNEQGHAVSAGGGKGSFGAPASKVVDTGEATSVDSGATAAWGGVTHATKIERAKTRSGIGINKPGYPMKGE